MVSDCDDLVLDVGVVANQVRDVREDGRAGELLMHSGQRPPGRAIVDVWLPAHTLIRTDTVTQCCVHKRWGQNCLLT